VLKIAICCCACIHFQIATFFCTNTLYEKQKAYCILLNKVPALPIKAITWMQSFLKANKDSGKMNCPRPFSTEEVAASGLVSVEKSLICY